MLVLPGFVAGASSTSFVRSFLRSKGYRVYDWGQGVNRGVRDGLRGRLTDRLDHITQRNQATISLVGWSAGGIYAREIARVRGNLRATSAWPAYTLLNRGRHAVDLTPEVLGSRAEPLSTPTTCLYSRYDGIVAWHLCTSLPSPTTENIEVRSTHLGFGHHRRTLGIVADRLALPEGAWRPYAC
ncbi:alpha/beta hydrolase [Nocardioides rubriscoriae]|uniref:alpha/beta hydrolase n=1 Tax=Nocardioides rubriscoriae TaxID=642762 RepID=UPI0011DEFF13|nr:alpha/beta hydrolase [Nocardioides rubriscoriae]